MSKDLTLTNKEQTMTSLELVELINKFRKEEETKGGKEYKEKLHKIMMRDIRSELETMESLGIEEGGYNFVPTSFIDSQGKTQPCYEITRDGALQILNKESTFVRVATIKYINTLEEKVKTQSQLPQLNPAQQCAMVVFSESASVPDKIKAIEVLRDVSRLEGGKIICDDSLITIPQIKELIYKYYGSELKEMNVILSESFIEFNRYMKYANYLYTKQFDRRDGRGKERVATYQPTEQFHEILVSQAMASVRTLNDKRDKVEFTYTKNIENLIATQSFKEDFLYYISLISR